MRLRSAILIMTMIAVVCTAAGQNTRRKGVGKTAKVHVPAAVVTPSADTIVGADTIAAIAHVGDYRKATVSRVESVMLTNLSKTDTIHAMDIDIDYRKIDGQQLNRRSVTLKSVIPPGETRFVSFQSFDRQQLFYYRGTPPARPTERTTPFDVTIIPLRLVISRP